MWPTPLSPCHRLAQPLSPHGAQSVLLQDLQGAGSLGGLPAPHQRAGQGGGGAACAPGDQPPACHPVGSGDLQGVWGPLPGAVWLQAVRGQLRFYKRTETGPPETDRVNSHTLQILTLRS